jgi:hypothetical protein
MEMRTELKEDCQEWWRMLCMMRTEMERAAMTGHGRYPWDE